MNPLASCPSCARSLGRFEANGYFRATCSNCRLRMEGFWGRVTHWQSKGEPVFYLAPNLPKLFRRRYQLRITTPGRELKQLQFTSPGLDDQLPTRTGDRLSIIYAGQRGTLEKLLSVRNHSLGRAYCPASPISSRSHLLKTRGGVSAAIGLGALFGGINPGVVSLGAAALAVGSRMTHAAELTVPELRGDRPHEARLLAELKLVQQKGDMEYRIEALRQEIQDHKDLTKRLQELRRKMMAYNPTLYAPRVARIESAVRLIKQRIDHTQRLIEEYRETIQMLDIELEASALADRLPDGDDFTRHVLERVEELKALEEKNKAGWDAIQAVPEVRRLRLNA
ncbi:hypothetical protein [Vacuolonema iberomarrocanum]|uniref:hypothetical protein n=1 Tax=Vacuolonema iberomarrocanum TaxID=3454632 RepID=UPI001A0ABBF9|nr:hypothetical protein [filamentous cyanobacterium LEGE 07170]